MKPEDIIKSYNAEGSIKKVAALFRVSEQKVRKVLIDAGAYESDMSIQVNDLYEQGYSRRCRVRQDTNRAPFKIMSVRCHLQGK